MVLLLHMAKVDEKEEDAPTQQRDGWWNAWEKRKVRWIMSLILLFSLVLNSIIIIMMII